LLGKKYRPTEVLSVVQQGGGRKDVKTGGKTAIPPFGNADKCSPVGWVGDRESAGACSRLGWGRSFETPREEG